ncbi:MAG: DUF4124 domain-containing protein [Proteobacteria bacterium]|nr:MAG: DUF4124 domain-containing protein [Pseudomonadota bacterium]
MTSILSSKHRVPLTVIGGLVGIMLATSIAAESRKLFRWVDEEGNVHYSDVVPPAHAKQGRSELNDRGLTVRSIDRAKTAEEIAEEQRQARIRTELERIAREQAAYDRALLDTYSSVEVMEQTRDSKISVLQGQIRVTEGNILNLRKQLDEQMNRAAALERNGKAVPVTLQNEIFTTQDQVRRGLEFILDRRDEIETLRQQFAKDIARYREVTEQAKDEAGEKPRSAM